MIGRKECGVGRRRENVCEVERVLSGGSKVAKYRGGKLALESVKPSSSDVRNPVEIPKESL